MKNKGFTLIEILGVITLLALLSTIIILSVNKSLKDSKEKLYNAQIEEIKSAAEMWRTDNIELVDESYNNLSISELQKKGYLKEKIINPKTNENIDNELLVQVSLNDIKVDDSLVQNGYRKLEYIESTGTQYIDSGYVPQIGDSYNLIFQPLVLNQNQVFVGSRTTGTWTTSMNQVYINQSNASEMENKLLFFSGISKINYPLLSLGQIYNYNFQISSGTYDGNNTNNLYIFALNNIGTAGANSINRLYELKIYNNGLVRNYVPCLRKSDNKPGLYDTINNQFYTNSGTGEFIYKLPTESPYDRLYTKLSYIKSTGTQYIDTGFKPNQDTRIIADFQYTNNNQGYRFTGSQHYGENNVVLNAFRFGSSISNVYLVAYGQQGNKSVGTPNTNRHVLDFNKNVVSLDDTVIYTFNYERFVTNYNAYIFSIDSNNIADLSPAKLYSYKMYDNDVLIRNFVPAKRNIDNVIGLYDEVNDKFYTNSGTGTFEYGI